MSFRQRLVLFLMATLIGVQVLTAMFVYGVVRRNLIEEGKRELAATAAVFNRQLTVLSERVSDDVQVLSLDYALRKAVGERDSATALSALRNHGNRIGATRMLIVGLDGTIASDTTHPEAQGVVFPFGGLIDSATNDDQGTALAVFDGQIYWIVVVPVRAPDPIAFIAACVPVDDVLLEKLRQLSPIPQSLALATPDANGTWNIKTRTTGYTPADLLASVQSLPVKESVVATEQDGDRLAMLARLDVADESAPVIAILDYPLDQALSAYTAVITPMLLVLAGALVVALVGAMLIAGGVSRPIEVLAAAARRIASGDYRPLPPNNSRDEVGALTSSLSGMIQSIAEREAALKGAVGSLELARTEAVKANDAKSQFLSNMSHELRTPLNAIIGFSEMICRQMMGAINIPRYAEYAQHVHDSGKHLLVQVQEMLDLSEAADGKLAIARQRLKPGGLLSTGLDGLKPIAAKAGVTLEVLGDPACWPTIEADAPKLQQSLVNLIDNAIKFTPQGGSVTISGEAAGQTLQITIADTGIGIGAEDLPLVVRPFHRRKPAFEARHQGAGLGLPFAKTIIELHGGTLAIDSTQGAGTTITIQLPVATHEALNDAA
jgi:signal transduction histidine kinase